jgi:PilZ domain
MTSPVGFVERRQFGRRNTAMHGWIVLPGRPKLACLVRNVSEGGALLECAAPKWMPFSFTLEIDCKGFTAECEVRHQKETWIGVRFERITAQSEPIATWSPLVEDSWAGERRPQLVK